MTTATKSSILVVLEKKFESGDLDLLTTYQITLDTHDDSMAKANEWLDNLSDADAMKILEEYFPAEVKPKTLAELTKLKIADALKEAEAKAREDAAQEWAKMEKEKGIREFAESCGGVMAAISKLQEVYGLKAVKGKNSKSSDKGRGVPISDETKAVIEKHLREEKSAAWVAKEVGRSVGAVNLIKKELGLTKSRK